MIIKSDWHIHSDASYDASLTLDEIIIHAKAFGFCKIGITDHVNYNTHAYLNDLKNSEEKVKAAKNPNIILGVELTPIAVPEYEYIAKNGTRDGYVEPRTSTPLDIDLPLAKNELLSHGVRYAIGASHWRTDDSVSDELNSLIKEWYRQQLWLAQDARVTVLGHPWYHSKGIWYQDFSIIPKSIHEEIGTALKEKGKYVECNAGVLLSNKASEKFRYQYAEFLRSYFEMGIPITYGSDAHKGYERARHIEMEPYLIAAGFKEGDFHEINEKDLW